MAGDNSAITARLIIDQGGKGAMGSGNQDEQEKNKKHKE